MINNKTKKWREKKKKINRSCKFCNRIYYYWHKNKKWGKGICSNCKKAKQEGVKEYKQYLRDSKLILKPKQKGAND